MHSKLSFLLLLSSSIEATLISRGSQRRNNLIPSQQVLFDTSLSSIELDSEFDSDSPEYVSMSDPDFSDPEALSPINPSSFNYLSMESLNFSDKDNMDDLSEIEKDESDSDDYLSMSYDLDLEEDEVVPQSDQINYPRHLFTFSESTIQREMDSDDIYPDVLE